MEIIAGVLIGFAIGSFIGWYLRTQKAKEDEAAAAKDLRYLRRDLQEHQRRMGL